MMLLPLYFQDIRHELGRAHGAVLMPQGLGAAFAMPVAGRLADRFGGGPLALAGVIVTAVSTLPLALVATDTPVWQIEASLLLRGLGIGIAIMPAMRRLWRPAAGADRRCDTAAHGHPARRRLDRNRRPRGRAGRKPAPRHDPCGRRRLICQCVLVGAGDYPARRGSGGNSPAVGAQGPKRPDRAERPGCCRGRTGGRMTATAPATDRELALEELRLALHPMLGARRRLRSRDVRLLGGVSFASPAAGSAAARRTATASALAVAADLAPATVTEMYDVLVAAGLSRAANAT